MNELMVSMLQQVKQLRLEQKTANRRRNILLAWMLAWLLAAPLTAAGWVWYERNNQPPAPPVVTVPDPVYPLASPPTCKVVGDWIVDDMNENITLPSDRYGLGDDHFTIAPDGLRDYEQVCLINIEGPDDYSSQSVGCSDRFGKYAKGGGLSSIASAEMCLAILRG